MLHTGSPQVVYQLSLAVLASLPPDPWAPAATVKGAGKTLERTVLGYADSLAVHERAHLKQMAWVAAAMM